MGAMEAVAVVIVTILWPQHGIDFYHQLVLNWVQLYLAYIIVAQLIQVGSTERIRQLWEIQLLVLCALIWMAIYVIHYIQYPESLLQTVVAFMYLI